LKKCDASIKIKSVWTPRKLKESDGIIMDYEEINNNTTKNRRIINNWRLYFQVSSISKIINYLGNLILESFRNKRKAQNYMSWSKLLWPVQKIPSMCTFNTWFNYIRQITRCDVQGNIPKNNRLGNWIGSPTDTIKIKAGYIKHDKKYYYSL
jgi:hypothetical protein